MKRKNCRQFQLDEELGAALKIAAIKKGKKLIQLKPSDVMMGEERKERPKKKVNSFRYGL